LTHPANGIHAINLIVYTIAEALQASGYSEPTIWRSHPITTVANNFDKLYFPPESLSRSPKYTRIIPDLLPRLVENTSLFTLVFVTDGMWWINAM
jgi:phenylalanyl-tRNA synthetase alpha chain